MKKAIIFLGAMIISLTLLTDSGLGQLIVHSGDAVSVWVTYAPPIILNVTSSLQNSTTFIFNVTTNKDAYCRYSNQSVGYDYMTDQFTDGEGTTLHWTTVNAQEGGNVFYASCGDTTGSNMTTATPIIFWWGTVKINDLYIVDGSVVNAYVNQNSTPAASAVVGSMLDNYYLVHIEAEDGDNVSFKVNNVPVDQSAQNWSAGDHQLNLSITVNDSLNSSVSLNSSQVTTVDAINETNTSLDIVTNSSVSGSVEIIKYPENPETNNLGLVEIKKYVQIEASPDINQSLLWAIIKVYYTDGELNGADENSLRIYYYNSTSGSWILLPDGGVDTVNKYVWTNTTHFSYYGLFGSAPSCGDGICNGAESCSSCPADCGACPAQNQGGGGGGIIQTSQPKNQTKTVSGQAQSCTENWSCTDWSTCANSQQTRTCTDVSNCGTTTKKPAESQSCAAGKVPTAESIVQTPTGLGTNEWMYYSVAAIIIIAIAAVLFIFRSKVVTVFSKEYHYNK